MPKIMKIDWQLTTLLQKLSGLLFLAHPVFIQRTILPIFIRIQFKQRMIRLFEEVTPKEEQ